MDEIKYAPCHEPMNKRTPYQILRATNKNWKHLKQCAVCGLSFVAAGERRKTCGTKCSRELKYKTQLERDRQRRHEARG